MVRMTHATECRWADSELAHVPGLALRGFMLCLALASWPAHVSAKPETLPSTCAKSFGDRLPGWRLASSPVDAAEWAKSQDLNPAVTAGDYNGDGRKDWAALATAGEKPVVAVCLSDHKRNGKKVVLIDSPCRDLVASASAGSRRPNLDTGRTEKLRRDAIVTSCFEKAGKTHVYERGAFRGFLHAD